MDFLQNDFGSSNQLRSGAEGELKELNSLSRQELLRKFLEVLNSEKRGKVKKIIRLSTSEIFFRSHFLPLTS